MTSAWDSPLSFGVQAFIEYNGYILNDRYQSDRIRVTKITGLDDADLSDSREVIPGDHGEFAYDALYRGRTLMISGRIEAGSLNSLTRLERDLKAAFGNLVEAPMKFRWFDVTDGFDDPQALLNYTTIDSSSLFSIPITVSSGVLRWGTTSPKILVRSADHRMWGDAQTSIRVVPASLDGSVAFIVPKMVDQNNYIKVQLTTIVPPSGFPNTPILDTFTRTSENPLSNSGAWNASVAPFSDIIAPNFLKTNGTAALSSAASGVVAGSAYAASEVSPVEVYADITIQPTGSQSIDLFWFTSLSTPNGYGLQINPSVHQLVKYVGGSGTSISGGVGQTWNNGDSAGLSISVTGQITLWRKPVGGSWTLLGTYTDTTFSGSGFIGILSTSNTATFDNFGGGSLPTPTLKVSAVVAGTDNVLSTQRINPLMQSSPVWLQSRTDGDIITAGIWLEPPSDDAVPDFSTSAVLQGSDSDLFGDQILSEVGFGADTSSTNWIFDDFKIQSLSPGDITFNVRKMPNGMSITESQDSISAFNRVFQITTRASRSFAQCATQSRSQIFTPNPGFSPGLGFSFPITFPLRFSLAIAGGVPANTFTTVVNRGTVWTRPKIFIYGAVSGGFTIANLQNGQQISWSGTLPDGDYLVFDCLRRTLVNSAGENQMAFFSSTSSRWMDLEPGPNDIYFAGSNYSSNTRMVVYYRSSWA